ncbi:hypothetical protein BD413DRAFT_48214 [Trametes elegans]|nr:hypothetical protein BD413DRAFT_48214 [Trametes elegans]
MRTFFRVGPSLPYHDPVCDRNEHIIPSQPAQSSVHIFSTALPVAHMSCHCPAGPSRPKTYVRSGCHRAFSPQSEVSQKPSSSRRPAVRHLSPRNPHTSVRYPSQSMTPATRWLMLHHDELHTRVTPREVNGERFGMDGHIHRWDSSPSDTVQTHVVCRNSEIRKSPAASTNA